VNWLQAFLLGIIQGLTEFLPVSSSGHLVIFQKLLGIVEHSLELDIVVHLGTLFAILTYYRLDLKNIVLDAYKGISQRKMLGGLRLVVLILVASTPTAFIGFAFRNDFKNLFSNLTAVGVFLCITGVLLLLTRNTIRTINAISGSVPSYPPPRPDPFSQEIAESLENKYYIPSEIDRNQAC